MEILTQSRLFLSACILFCIFTSMYLYLTRNFNYWKKRGIKQIMPIPFIGNIGSYIFNKKSFVRCMQEVYEAGDDNKYVGIYIIDKPYLVVRDPEVIKHILIKDFNNFTNKNFKSSKVDIIGSKSIFTVDNPEWKLARQQLSPVFSTGKLKKMFQSMLEIDQNFVTFLDSLDINDEGCQLEMKEICATFTTDLIGKIAYGLDFKSLEKRGSHVRTVGRNIFEKNLLRKLELISTFFIPALVDIFNIRFFGKDATDSLVNIFKEAIEYRRTSNIKREDLLDFIINLKNYTKDEKLDTDTMVAHAAVIFTGGFETSSTTMSFALYELAWNPDLQARLREEIINELDKNNGKLTYEMVTSSFPYLNMVIAEILRMYPILPFLDRVAIDNYKVPNSNFIIEKGTSIIVPMQSIQMDPNYFPEPHIFDPERFSSENKHNIKSNTYFPFGEGPRMCIGMRLAYLQVKMGLLRLISKYEFSPVTGAQRESDFDTQLIFMSFKNDVILNVRKIKTA